ncbi:MAG: hypothetical protein FWB75_02985, partial [Oscillospiraceae bacterium]|nr:hypothetical protein [Oscillospiraceae bacterium]
PIDVDPDAHDWSEWAVRTAPTCQHDGVEYRTCEHCSLEQTRPIDVDPDAHDWSEWAVRTEPTCQHDGVEYRTCEHCSLEQTRPIDVDPDAHDWSEWAVRTAPTCQHDGVEYRICEHCSLEQTRPIDLDPGAHNWRDWEEYAPPTCGPNASAGVEYRICLRCGYRQTRPGDPALSACTPGEWVLILMPTSENEGRQERHCIHCDELYDYEILPIIDGGPGYVPGIDLPYLQFTAAGNEIHHIRIAVFRSHVASPPPYQTLQFHFGPDGVGNINLRLEAVLEDGIVTVRRSNGENFVFPSGWRLDIDILYRCACDTCEHTGDAHHCLCGCRPTNTPTIQIRIA